MMMMLLLTELVVIVLFLLFFSSYTFFTQKLNIKKQFFFLFFTVTLIVFFGAVPYATSKYFHTNNFVYFSILDIIARDLFIYFYYFFIAAPFTTLLLATLLGLMSIFFIAMYFTLKHSAQNVIFKTKQYFILRKQNQFRQSAVRSGLKFFQR